jgi:hypothetical protein
LKYIKLYKVFYKYLCALYWTDDTLLAIRKCLLAFVFEFERLAFLGCDLYLSGPQSAHPLLSYL